MPKNEDIKRIKQKLKKRPKRRKADMRRLIIAAAIFAAQIVLLIWALYRMNAFVLSSYVVLQLVSSISVIKIVLNRNNPSYKVAWIALILLVPVLGLVFYLMWGRGSYPKKIKKVLPEIAQMTVPLHRHSKETERLLNQEFRHRRLFPPEDFMLLHEFQQVRHEILEHAFFVLGILHVEDERILAVFIGIEVFVGIVE